MKTYTQAELDAMPLDQLRRLIHKNELEIARIRARQTAQIETAALDPEWAEIARLNAWKEAQPTRLYAPKDNGWPTGYKTEEYVKGFVAKQFAGMGARPAEDTAVSETAKAFLKQLG